MSLSESPAVVLVTDRLAEDGLEILRNQPGIELRVALGLEADDLLEAVSTAEALLVRSGTKVTEEVLTAAPRLKVVGRAGTGVDNIDVTAATRRGVVVMNTPGGNSVAACEHTFAVLLALMRSVPRAAAELAEGVWNRKKYMGHQLEGRTLGLIGFGRIGREVATRARAFGMHVLVDDPFVSDALAREFESTLADRETVLRQADVISLHTPLTAETRHLIDAAALALMKPSAVIVNCARGGLIDETALLEALNADRIAGAALDVFEAEPPSELALVQHPRVVATPHLGASTEEAQRTVAADIARQVVAYLDRGEVRGAVNMPSLSAELYARVKPWVDLAERLGSLSAQFAGGRPKRVDIRFRGECTELPRGPVVSGVLLGALRTTEGGEAANYVNARLMSSELGVAVEESAVDDAGDHTGLLEVRIESDAGSSEVAGTIRLSGAPHLVRWEESSLDAPAAGHLLALRNPDVPGVVGAIGGLLGEAGVNIAHISWGRNPESGEAFTLINLDEAVSAEVLARIGKHPQVRWARAVRLS